MDGAAELSLGQRVAVLRKLRGLTQEGLALRLNRSTSWVTKIERGARRIDSMAVLQELARALAVPVHQLTGRSDPAAMDGNSAAGDDLTELRRALDRSGAIAHGSSTEEPPRVDDLCQEAAALRQLYNTSARNFSAVVPLLAGLINEAQRAAVLASGHDRLAAYASLSAFYRIASLELRQRGDLTRARVAVDRALMAAEQADNGLLVASIAATMTVQLMIQGDPEDAVALALDAAEHVRRQPNADTPLAWSSSVRCTSTLHRLPPVLRTVPKRSACSRLPVKLVRTWDRTARTTASSSGRPTWRSRSPAFSSTSVNQPERSNAPRRFARNGSAVSTAPDTITCTSHGRTVCAARIRRRLAP